jgi:hypothetical protein
MPDVTYLVSPPINYLMYDILLFLYSMYPNNSVGLALHKFVCIYVFLC